ncbi:MAG: hypothetical protein R3Y05_06450, partial [bacterium]
LRNTETVELLNYGFSTFKKEVIIPEGEILLEFNSLLYKPSIFKLINSNNISVLKNKNDELLDMTYELIYSNDHNETPQIIVYYDNKKLGIFDIEYSEEVEKRNIFDLMGVLFKKMIS